MSLGYLQNIIKAKAFRLYFSTQGMEDKIQLNGGSAWVDFFIGNLIWTITKDGGSSSALTNTPVAVDGGIGFIDLTASEMSADVVCIRGAYVNNPTGGGIKQSSLSISIIYTISDELTTVPDKNSTLADKITFLFQYFRNRRTVTASDSKLYKEDETTELGNATLDDDGVTFNKGEFS